MKLLRVQEPGNEVAVTGFRSVYIQYLEKRLLPVEGGELSILWAIGELDNSLPDVLAITYPTYRTADGDAISSCIRVRRFDDLNFRRTKLRL